MAKRGEEDWEILNNELHGVPLRRHDLPTVAGNDTEFFNVLLQEIQDIRRSSRGAFVFLEAFVVEKKSAALLEAG